MRCAGALGALDRDPRLGTATKAPGDTPKAGDKLG